MTNNIPLSDASQGAAGKLTPDQALGLINLVVKTSQVVRTLLRTAPNFVSMKVDTGNFPVLNSGVAAEWIGEGDIKPASTPGYTSLTLTLKELALTVPVSDRLLQNAYIDQAAVVAEQIANEFAQKLDKAILGVGTPAAWGANASFNAAATAASNTFNGINYTDTGKFFSAMLAVLEGQDGFDATKAMWYIKPAVKAVLRDERTSIGSPLFIENPVTEDGTIGQIYGVPVTYVDSGKFPTGVDVFLVDRSKAYYGTRFDSVQVARSTDAAYTRDGSLVSAYERDETVWRAYALYAFNVSDVEGFVLGSGTASIG